MEQRCNDCKYKLDIEKLDYSGGGCKHSDPGGFVCTAFASEGVASWMVGLDPEINGDICECFTERRYK